MICNLYLIFFSFLFFANKIMWFSYSSTIQKNILHNICKSVQVSLDKEKNDWIWLLAFKFYAQTKIILDAFCLPKAYKIPFFERDENIFTFLFECHLFTCDNSFSILRRKFFWKSFWNNFTYKLFVLKKILYFYLYNRHLLLRWAINYHSLNNCFSFFLNK